MQKCYSKDFKETLVIMSVLNLGMDIKQAFILSTSDVSTWIIPPGAGYCGLTTRTISYFKNSGLKNIWLRTPGNANSNISSIRFPSLNISAVGIINNQTLIPALVIHID